MIFYSIEMGVEITLLHVLFSITCHVSTLTEGRECHSIGCTWLQRKYFVKSGWIAVTFHYLYCDAMAQTLGMSYLETPEEVSIYHHRYYIVSMQSHSMLLFLTTNSVNISLSIFSLSVFSQNQNYEREKF